MDRASTCRAPRGAQGCPAVACFVRAGRRRPWSGCASLIQTQHNSDTITAMGCYPVLRMVHPFVVCQDRFLRKPRLLEGASPGRQDMAQEPKPEAVTIHTGSEEHTSELQSRQY